MAKVLIGLFLTIVNAVFLVIWIIADNPIPVLVSFVGVVASIFAMYQAIKLTQH